MLNKYIMKRFTIKTNSNSNKKGSTETSSSNQMPALAPVPTLSLKIVPLSLISQIAISPSNLKVNPSNKKAPKPSNNKKSYT